MRQPGSRLGADFGWLWAGNGGANLADGILLAGLPVLATRVTTSPGLVAGVHVALTLAMVTAALPAGLAADGSRPARMIVFADLVRAAGLAVVLLLTSWAGPTVAAVYAAALLAGSTEVLADATSEAAVPRLVPDRHLERANARVVGTQVAMNNAVGAPLGSALAAAGLLAGFGVPAALYAVSAFAISRVRMPPRQVGGAPKSRAHQLGGGIRVLRNDPTLARLAASNSLMNLGNTAFFAVAVLLVIGPIGLPRSTYGLLLTAVAVGGIVGATLVRRGLEHAGARRVMFVSRIAAAGSYTALAVSGDLLLLAAAALALGASGTAWNVTSRTVRQRLVPPGLLGRTTTAMKVVGMAMAPVGAGLAGVVATAVGVRAAASIAPIATLVSLGVLAGVDLTPRRDRDEVDGGAMSSDRHARQPS